MSDRLTDPPPDLPSPPQAIPHLRYLRGLVSALAVVMALGIAAIVALLWLRLAPGGVPVLPADLRLPQGAVAQAVTVARDWTIVVTQAGEVLVYDRAGMLTQRLTPGG